MDAGEDVALQFGGAFAKGSHVQASSIFAVLDSHGLRDKKRTDVTSSGEIVSEADGASTFMVTSDSVLTNASLV